MKVLIYNLQHFKVTPEIAVKFTNITVYLTCIWSPSHGRIRIALFEIFLYLSVFNSLALLVPLITAINKYSADSVIVMKSAILISAILNYLIKVCVVRIHYKRFQKLGWEMESFLTDANDHQKAILQKYVNKYWKFQGYMTCNYYLTSIVVILGPFILPQKFPSDAVYPFPVDSPVATFVVYMHQSFAGFQNSAAMCLDCQAALFLWYIGGRFEMLATEIEDILNYKSLQTYIKKHQDLLLYANEVIRPVRIIALTTVTMTKVGMVFGGIMLVSNQPLIVKMQFTILVISASANILVCVRAADNLMNVSSSLMSDKAFYACWTYSPVMRKIWLFFIQRVQTPVTVDVSGFLDSLSFKYYSAFLSASFSYFTTMRATVNS